MSKHLTIARTKGPKAGFNALREYLETPLGAANPRMEDAREALSGSRKKAFAAYCEMFLDGDEAPATPAQRIAERITGTSTRKRKGRKPAKAVAAVEDAGAKERTWSAFWVERNGIPTKPGATFTYTSKKYGTVSKHKVVRKLRDGSVVTIRTSLARG